MNSEVFAEARSWLLSSTSLPVRELCELVGAYLLTPVPGVHPDMRIDVCDCTSLKPSLCWLTCTYAEEDQHLTEWADSAAAGSWVNGLGLLNEMCGDTRSPCTYLELKSRGYLSVSASFWEFRGRVRRGVDTVLVTLPHVPRPWNGDWRNTNRVTLQWPFLIYSTHHRDGPTFTAHILDLRSDLSKFAELQVWFPVSIGTKDVSCFLEQGCLFVGIHEASLGDGKPDRMACFSLDDLPFSQKPNRNLAHRSLFAAPGHALKGHSPGAALPLSFQDSMVSMVGPKKRVSEKPQSKSNTRKRRKKA